MNLTTMLSMVRSNLLEPNAPAFFSDADIVGWINESYMKCIQDIMGFKVQKFVKSFNITWVNGTSTYALPLDYLRSIRVERVLDNGRKFPLKEITRFDSALNPSLQTDFPNYEFLDNNIIFEPTPQISLTNACLMSYIFQPARLVLTTNETPNISFPDLYHDILVLYATMSGKMKEGENINASAFAARYDDTYKSFLNAISDVSETRKSIEPFDFEMGNGAGSDYL